MDGAQDYPKWVYRHPDEGGEARLLGTADDAAGLELGRWYEDPTGLELCAVNVADTTPAVVVAEAGEPIHDAEPVAALADDLPAKKRGKK